MNVQLNIFDAAIEAEKEMANIMAVQSAQKAATKKEKRIAKRIDMIDKQKKLDDFGEKIGGARKDLWKDRGLILADLEFMNDQEKSKYVVKNNCWPKPDYQKLVDEGRNKKAVFMIKTVRDALPVRPTDDAVITLGVKKAQETYVAGVEMVKKMAEAMTDCNDTEKIHKRLFDDGYVKYHEVYRFYVSVQPKGRSFIDQKFLRAIGKSARRDAEYDMKRKHFLENSTLRATSNVKKRYKLTPLETVRSEGYDYRHGVQATPEMLLDLGFRGGEFGNWTNQKERQLNLDHCYDSINNMAMALGITPEQLLCPKGAETEPLAIAFGSRGVAYSAAHYESMRHVINLTKMHGAGSLAHELGHYIDNYISIMTGGSEWSAVEAQSYKKIDIRKEIEAVVNAMRTRYLSHEETMERLQAQVLEYDRKQREVVQRAEKRLSEGLSAEEWELAKEKYFEACRENSDWKMNSWRSNTPSAELQELISFDPKGAGRNLMMNTQFLTYLRNSYVLSVRELNKAAADHSYRLTGKTKFLETAEELDSTWCKFGHGYWASPCEMFARAFACYIKDKLEEKGIVDDYLTGHSELLGHTEGEERKNINAAIDSLLEKMKSLGLF